MYTPSFSLLIRSWKWGKQDKKQVYSGKIIISINKWTSNYKRTEMQFLILWIIHKNVINGEWALIYSPDRGLIKLGKIKFLHVLPCWVSTVCPLYFYSSRHPCFIRFWILLDQCLQIMKFLSKLLVFIVYWIIEFSFYIIITVIWFPFMQIWTNSCRSVQV